MFIFCTKRQSRFLLTLSFSLMAIISHQKFHRPLSMTLAAFCCYCFCWEFIRDVDSVSHFHSVLILSHSNRVTVRHPTILVAQSLSCSSSCSMRTKCALKQWMQWTWTSVSAIYLSDTYISSQVTWVSASEFIAIQNSKNASPHRMQPYENDIQNKRQRQRQQQQKNWG